MIVQDEQLVIAAVAKVAAVGLMISSLEFISARRCLQDDGLMSWQVARTRDRFLGAGASGALLDSVLAYPTVLGLLAFRAALALAVIVAPPGLIPTPWLVFPLALMCWLFVSRSMYGQDGADQMLWIIFAGLTFVSVAPTHAVRMAYLWFIAAQGCLSYFTAGVAKFSAKGWRDGTFLTAIVATRIYGHPKAAQLLAAHPRLAMAMSRVIVAWECGFPLVFLLPRPVALAIMATGVCFHLGNAMLMGLNTFLWAFLATYPAIVYALPG